MSSGEVQGSLGDDRKYIKWRKSKKNDDSKNAAEELLDSLDIEKYTADELSDLIKSGASVDELSFTKTGRSYSLELNELEEWYEERVKPNTVVLDKEDYLKALSRSFELLTVGEVAKTDFGSARQREFGQQWTDFTRGYLGEIAVKKFFENKHSVEVNLKQRDDVENVQDTLPTDLRQYKSEGEWKDVGATLSIKTSKLGSMWLAIPSSQIGHSDAFAFVKIGIPLDHIAVFLREYDLLDPIFENIEEKKTEEIKETIPDFKPIPAYIPGFAWKEELKSDNLDIEKKTKHAYVTGGIGEKPDEPPEGMTTLKVRGLGDPSEKYFASTGSLNFEEGEWKIFIDEMTG